MATWRGYELPQQGNALQQMRGDRKQRQPELPDEWNFPGPWEDAEPDYNPKPGQKGYDTRMQMASARKPTAPPDPNALRFSRDAGYWLANTPASSPPAVWLDYLNWMAGQEK